MVGGCLCVRKTRANEPPAWQRRVPAQSISRLPRTFTAAGNCLKPHQPHYGGHPARNYPTTSHCLPFRPGSEVAYRMPFLSPSLFEELALESRGEDAAVIFKSNLLRRISPFLCGSTNIPHGESVLLDGLHQIAEEIPLPQPALYDGTFPTEIEERVKGDLQHLVMPSTANPQAPAAPNFFLEIKAPGEDGSLIRCRACYNGALGARAIRSLRNYGSDEPTYDGKVDAYTATYDPETGILEIYAAFIIRSERPGQPVEYHNSNMGSWNLRDNRESFVRGATAFRNARDLAKEIRDGAIREANGKVRPREPRAGS